MALPSTDFSLLSKELPLLGRSFILFVSKIGFKTSILSLFNRSMEVIKSILFLLKRSMDLCMSIFYLPERTAINGLEQNALRNRASGLLRGIRSLLNRSMEVA